MKKLAITIIAATLSFGAMAGDPVAGKAKVNDLCWLSRYERH